MGTEIKLEHGRNFLRATRSTITHIDQQHGTWRLPTLTAFLTPNTRLGG